MNTAIEMILKINTLRNFRLRIFVGLFYSGLK